MAITTITTATRPEFVRGDYITLSGIAGVSGKRRVVRLSRGTLDTRRCARHRPVEWLRARIEDCLLWPLADLKAKLRVRQ